VEITKGNVKQYRYINGSYRLQKELRKVVSGVAVSGSTVTLDGYWYSQPEIICSLNSLKSYDGNYSAQNQELSIQATNINWNESTGICTFKPIANLVVVGSSQTTTPTELESKTYHYKEPTEWTVYSSTYTVPANTTSILINCRASAQRYEGTGGGGVYYAMTCRIRAIVSDAGTFDVGYIQMPESSYSDINTNPHWEYLQNTISFSASAANRTIELQYYFYRDSRSSYNGAEATYDTWPNYSGYWAYFTSFKCNMPGSVVDSAGQVNYLAIGE
jgi:hypothetical protein